MLQMVDDRKLDSVYTRYRIYGIIKTSKGKSAREMDASNHRHDISDEV